MEDYLQEHATHVLPEKTIREYVKFGLVIFSILIVSVLLTLTRGWTTRQFLNDFMAVFFIVFAAFKFIGLEMFVVAYRGYDIIAQQFKLWPYIFPFIEAGLGFAYLLTDKNSPLNLFTMVITGAATIGVWRELHPTERRRSHFQCACLGNIIKLPLSTVSLFEDVVMFAMALVMLFI